MERTANRTEKRVEHGIRRLRVGGEHGAAGGRQELDGGSGRFFDE